MERVAVVEYTDPICSWAWGTEPKLRLLRWRHGHRMTWRVVMGGLVGDATNGRSDWDPVLAAKPMSAYWRQSSAYTGQPYPFPMRRMAKSTDPAGRAVNAAREQGDDVADRVLRRFRESTFVFGETPETPEQFAASAAGVPGLDMDRWLAALRRSSKRRGVPGGLGRDASTERSRPQSRGRLGWDRLDEAFRGT